MTALIVGIPLGIAVAALLYAGWLGYRPEPAHGDPSWPQRAGKRARDWWATVRALAAEDQKTIAWLDVVHDGPDDPGAAIATAAKRYREDMGYGEEFFAAPTTDVPDRETGSALWPAPAPAGDTPSAAMVAGETPAQAPIEPHETAALGAQLPNRGDAQGRDGGCAPPESRPAARADLTGSLSPRPLQERPGPMSAPQDPGTPEPRTADVEPGPEPGAPRAGARDPVPAAVAWARAELTGHHGHADTGAFPKVTGVA